MSFDAIRFNHLHFNICDIVEMLTPLSTQAACLPPKSALFTRICENHILRLVHVAIHIGTRVT